MLLHRHTITDGCCDGYRDSPWDHCRKESCVLHLGRIPFSYKVRKTSLTKIFIVPTWPVFILPSFLLIGYICIKFLLLFFQMAYRYVQLRRDYFVAGATMVQDACTPRDQELVSQLLSIALHLTKANCMKEKFHVSEVLSAVNALFSVQDFRPGQTEGATPASDISSAKETLAIVIESIEDVLSTANVNVMTSNSPSTPAQWSGSKGKSDGGKAQAKSTKETLKNVELQRSFINSLVLSSFRVFLRHNKTSLSITGGQTVVEQLSRVLQLLLTLGNEHLHILDSTGTHLALSDCLFNLSGCMLFPFLETSSEKDASKTKNSSLKDLLGTLAQAAKPGAKAYDPSHFDVVVAVVIPLLCGYATKFAGSADSSVIEHISSFVEKSLWIMSRLPAERDQQCLVLSSYLQQVLGQRSPRPVQLKLSLFSTFSDVLRETEGCGASNDMVHLVDRVTVFAPVWSSYVRSRMQDLFSLVSDAQNEYVPFLKSIVSAYGVAVRNPAFNFQVRLSGKNALAEAANFALHLLLNLLPTAQVSIVHEGCDLLSNESNPSTSTRLLAAIDRVLDLQPGQSDDQRAAVRTYLLSLIWCLYYLRKQQQQPQQVNSKAIGAWRRVFSAQRKRQVVRMLRVSPLFKAHERKTSFTINLFLKVYQEGLLSSLPPLNVNDIIIDLKGEREKIQDDSLNVDGSDTQGDSNQQGGTLADVDRVGQLIRVFTTRSDVPADLFLQFATVLSKSCTGADVYTLDMVEGDDDDDDDGGDEDEMEAEQHSQDAQRLRDLRQTFLCERGAAQMVIQLIGNCNGVASPMVHRSIKLAIAMLNGGNTTVQQTMLSLLKGERSSHFFLSLQQLISECTVVDLDHLRRISAVSSNSGALLTEQRRALDAMREEVEFVCDLFRFLQLLCEGHFEEFQDYLRAQPDSNVTANIVVDSVDYLLRLQESIADMFVHESGGTQNPVSNDILNSSIRIGTQLFRTLTEYMQGPCEGNQNSLSQSRLWDAVGGFFLFFAEMQTRLMRDPSQIELLREIRDMLVSTAISTGIENKRIF